MVEEKISELVASLQALKDYNSGVSKYQTLLADLEAATNELTTAEAEDFTSAQEKVKPLFIALYIQFG